MNVWTELQTPSRPGEKEKLKFHNCRRCFKKKAFLLGFLKGLKRNFIEKVTPTKF